MQSVSELFCIYSDGSRPDSGGLCKWFHVQSGCGSAWDNALPPVSGFADDIQDIVLPTEMDWKRDESITIKTESFRGGVWHYAGKVEVVSLKDFMVSSMQDNKWKLVGEVASKNIMLAFVKPNKTCMMVIEEAAFGKTELTLYVTIDKTAAAALNPFGEAVAPE